MDLKEPNNRNWWFVHEGGWGEETGRQLVPSYFWQTERSDQAPKEIK